MKRKGRQHGMVRTCRILPSPLNPRPNTRIMTRFDSSPTAGLFTKVPSKPTNHSKFTGKCGTPRCTGCHFHPVCKSKNKTKGNQKHKYGRVGQPDSNFSGLSATMTLDGLSSRYLSDDDVDEESDDHVDYYVTSSCNLNDDNGDDRHKCISQVGFSCYKEQKQADVEDEDWCLVEYCS